MCYSAQGVFPLARGQGRFSYTSQSRLRNAFLAPVLLDGPLRNALLAPVLIESWERFSTMKLLALVLRESFLSFRVMLYLHTSIVGLKPQKGGERDYMASFFAVTSDNG